MKKDLSKEDLERTVRNQFKIIEGYESIAFFYRLVRKVPFLSLPFRFIAGILKSGKGSGTKVQDEVNSNNPEIIAVSNPEFRGVTSATKEMVKDVFLVTEIFSRKTAEKIAEQILEYNPKKVVISGYAKGHEMLTEELKKKKNDLKVYFLVHSAFIWFDVYPSENAIFEKFLELAKEGIIEKIGFCKKDLAEYFKMLGYNSYFVMNRFYPEKHELKKINGEKVKIGIWGKNFWHRNLTNQTVAALMVEDTEIHVNEIAGHNFLDQSRIEVHGFLPKEKFHKIFKNMDINLYVSMTECFPMTVIESMQFGIPCIVSDTSDVYSFDQELKKKLTVSTVDGPLGIKVKIEEVIQNYGDIQEMIKRYLPKLNKEVEKSIEEFLN